MGNTGGGNIFSVFQEDPQDMPGQGLARTDNYKDGVATQQYGSLVRDFYNNQNYSLQREQELNPQWLALQNQSAQQAGGGIMGVYGQMLPGLSAYQNAANTATINSVGANRAGYDAINPQMAALYASLLNTAQQQVNMGSQLDPATQYQVSNGVRNSYADRGMGNSNAAQLSEAMALYGSGEQTRTNRLANAQSIGQQAQNFYNPLYSFLSQANALPGQAMSMTGYAQQQAANAGATQLNANNQASLLNNVYGQLQAANRTQAGLETQVGMHQADIWNDWGKTATGMGMGGGGGGGGMGMCWAAREIFGATNPKWKQFRRWLLNDAPTALREWYRTNGETLAKVLSTATTAERDKVRTIMESKLA